jgi:hypothetical protein
MRSSSPTSSVSGESAGASPTFSTMPHASFDSETISRASFAEPFQSF